MIIYKSINKNNKKQSITKEKLENRKRNLERFNKKIQKQVKINKKRKILSIEYTKRRISD